MHMLATPSQMSDAFLCDRQHEGKVRISGGNVAVRMGATPRSWKRIRAPKRPRDREGDVMSWPTFGLLCFYPSRVAQSPLNPRRRDYVRQARGAGDQAVSRPYAARDSLANPRTGVTCGVMQMPSLSSPRRKRQRVKQR